jgi:hypothetical protein
MRVRSLATPVLADTSDATFTITSLTPRLQVDSPNGGEGWREGDVRVIRWTSALVTSDVGIALSRDSGATWETLTPNTANDGYYLLYWVTRPETEQARIRIWSVDDPTVEDVSDDDFSISPLYDARLRDVRPLGGGQIELQWTDTDWEDEYEIYRGTLTVPFAYSHDTVLACAIPGGSTFWVSPDDQQTGQPSYYYLVVPRRDDTRQFGEASDGTQRPAAAATCP